MSWDGGSGGRCAAAGSGSDFDCHNAVLGIGDPRTGRWRLSGGIRGLPAASQLVSARLGIDGALSLRHLCFWTFLLSTSLLPLSGGLPTPASIDSCRTSGPSSAISASWLVVVKMRSSFLAGAFGEFLIPVKRKSLPTVIRLVVVLAPLLVASLFWTSYHNHASSAAPTKATTAARSSTSSSMTQRTAHIDSSGSEGLSNAQSAILFSVAPLTSLSAILPSVDPDPVASFRQLIALPSDTAHEAPHIDPRRMRTIVDRGVVGYASAKTDGERAKSAGLIQTAALVGFSPARDLLVRNYPQSEAVRSVVPANDVIRYALGPVMDVAATGEDFEGNIRRARAAFPSRTAGFVRRPDPQFNARRLASPARLSDRHLAGLVGARARSVSGARPPGTGRGRDCRPGMLFQRKPAQVH